jgi:hypothetical protein
MKKAYVSLVALALVFASFSASAFANGEAVASNFSVSMTGFPDTISRGDTLTGTISITLAGQKDPFAKRQRVRVEVFVATPLGNAPVRTATLSMLPGTTRTLNVAIPVDKTAAPGLYAMKLVVTVGGETAAVGHELRVQ